MITMMYWCFKSDGDHSKFKVSVAAVVKMKDEMSWDEDLNHTITIYCLIWRKNSGVLCDMARKFNSIVRQTKTHKIRSHQKSACSQDETFRSKVQLSLNITGDGKYELKK